jgi:PIN domain nuclease of toxin-antitoxin system
MRLLLDTHVYLWCTQNSKHLSPKTRSRILTADEVYVSSASIWEAVIKAKLGKLTVKIDALIGAIAQSGFIELPISAKHALEVSRLPDLHRDPFDRILIAQAISEPLRFLTADTTLQKYSELIEVI